MSTKIDLTDLGGGAVGERFLYEMNKVLAYSGREPD